MEADGTIHISCENYSKAPPCNQLPSHLKKAIMELDSDILAVVTS